jgi:hypothetical protein
MRREGKVVCGEIGVFAGGFRKKRVVRYGAFVVKLWWIVW